MTITEARNVNLVLNELVRQVSEARGEGDFEVLLPEATIGAAEYLAVRANRVLNAGWTGPRVREALS